MGSGYAAGRRIFPLMHLTTRHVFSEIKQRPYRHPRNYLTSSSLRRQGSTAFSLKAIEITGKVTRILNRIPSVLRLGCMDSCLRRNDGFGVLMTSWTPACAGVTARCGSQAKLCLGSPSFRDDGSGWLQEFVEC